MVNLYAESYDLAVAKFPGNSCHVAWQFVYSPIPLGSVLASKFVQKTMKILESHGCNISNTLLAKSICCDEINFGAGTTARIFSDYFGAAFHLGSLAGIPFSGKAGFNAFASHVPDGEIIYLNPHENNFYLTKVET